MQNFRRFTNLVLVFVLVFSGVQISGQDNDHFTWPENYLCAVVLTYDDGLDCHLDNAIPALDRHSFKGTFFCPGHSASLYQRVDEWRSIVTIGHELGNHSLFHPCDGKKFDWVKPETDLNNYTLDQIISELRVANTLLKAVDGKEDRTYAYTCSDFEAGGESFVEEVRDLFIAARGGGPIPESMEDLDYHYVPSWGVIDPTGEELIEYVKEAKEKRTIAVFMFHSVGGGYLNVSSEAHEELLSYLEKNKDVIWTDTFINVMKWVKEHRP